MKKSRFALAALAVASILVAACSDDNTSSTTTTAATDDSTMSTEGPVDTTASALAMDTNGDGKVQFGIAAAGPRDDGGYY
ncbi:MAG: hypothetical protein F2749_15250, partial [Actinobacteria bacterium]|nr:hypothetical protein [Actinomycetota bacterium]